MNSVRFIATLVFAVTTVVCELRSEEVSVTELVDRLDSESYQLRQSSMRRLLEIGKDSRGQAEAVRKALRQGLTHKSLEVRSACQHSLATLREFETDREIVRLLDLRIHSEDIALPGWQTCSQLLGDDRQIRHRFASLTRKHPSLVRALDNNTPIAVSLRALISLDPYQISPSDLDRWIILLLLETVHSADLPANLAYRTCMSLSNSQLGPKPVHANEVELFGRVIDRWLSSRTQDNPMRESLLIAMRFGCIERAFQLSEQVLKNELSPPATVVTAMLCANAIELPGCEDLIESRLSDQRTAHVWQLIALRKTKIRTQVRDVAIALQLHRHGIDPRAAGFVELQADPRMVFLDHSLGFADNRSREDAHAWAKTKIRQIRASD